MTQFPLAAIIRHINVWAADRTVRRGSLLPFDRAGAAPRRHSLLEETMKRLLTLLASLILPGVGQVLRGRIAVGIAFFVGFVALLDVFAYAAFRTPPAAEWQIATVLGCLCLVWFGCQAHLGYLLYGLDPNRDAERKELAFHEGLRYYLRDELPEAIRQFESVLRMDRFDRDAHFHLGVCLSRGGSYRRAIRCFKKCIEFDDDRKWAGEVAEEIHKAEQQRKTARKSKAD